MKRFTFSLLMTLCCAMLLAQQKLSFSVIEFEQDVFDTSAKSSEYGKKDGNGSWYAIIKVTSNNHDDDINNCQFNFGNMANKVVKHDEALWVYVQRNAKKVTISRPGYHTISQYDLQTTIEAGANYKMVLTSDRVQQQVVYDVKMQMVKFQTSPIVEGAMITMTNQATGQKIPVGVTSANGAVSKALDYGRYTYEVLDVNNLYHPSEGILTLNDSKVVFTENVILRPNFADISLTVGTDAEIFINNEPKGHGNWSGKLSPGIYMVTCKKLHHHDTQQRLVVEEGKAQNLALTAPIPIIGTLVLNTTPTDANISIDGVSYGKSPQIIGDVLIGNHKVTLSLNGYKSETMDVIIEEGKTANIDVNMQKGASNENGYEYVDLGLPSGLLWAKYNVGATSETTSGDYYAWGETTSKSTYTKSNYTYSANPTKLPLDRDVAHVKWGGNWRMPTSSEIDELISNCTTTWTTIGGVNGYKVTGPNGNYIFLPAAGYFGSSLEHAGLSGSYRSSSQHAFSISNAYELYFNSVDFYRDYNSCYYGQSVRPVFSK